VTLNIFWRAKKWKKWLNSQFSCLWISYMQTCSFIVDKWVTKMCNFDPGVAIFLHTQLQKNLHKGRISTSFLLCLWWHGKRLTRCSSSCPLFWRFFPILFQILFKHFLLEWAGVVLFPYTQLWQEVSFLNINKSTPFRLPLFKHSWFSTLYSW